MFCGINSVHVILNVVFAIIFLVNEAVAGIRAYSTKVCLEKTADKVFSFTSEFDNYFYPKSPCFSNRGSFIFFTILPSNLW